MGLEDDERSQSGRFFPIPKNERTRLKILYQTDLLDTKEEEDYDRYTSMAARLFHVRYETFHFRESLTVFLFTIDSSFFS